MSGAPPDLRKRTVLQVSLAIIVAVLVIGMLTAYLSRRKPREGGIDPRFEGVRRMAERLQRITAESDPSRNPFMNAGKVRNLEREVAAQRGEGGEAPLPLLIDLAAQLLNSGRTGDAIALLDRLEGMLKERHIDPHSRQWSEVRLRQAIANLRRG